MPKDKSPLTLKLVAANDNQDLKARRNPLDPRLISLAKILARSAAQEAVDNITCPANDNEITEDNDMT